MRRAIVAFCPFDDNISVAIDQNATRARWDHRIYDATHAADGQIQCTHLTLHSDVVVASAVMVPMRRGRG
jgi:hypothetical protein